MGQADVASVGQKDIPVNTDGIISVVEAQLDDAHHVVIPHVKGLDATEVFSGSGFDPGFRFGVPMLRQRVRRRRYEY